MIRASMDCAQRQAGVARRRAACLALTLLLCGAAAGEPVAAQATALEVAFVANGLPVACAAEDVLFALAPQTTVSWRCVAAPSRMRCQLTTAAQFAVEAKIVALDCNRLTELPSGDPATLIFAAGFESP